jgi:hypothetical protein
MIAVELVAGVWLVCSVIVLAILVLDRRAGAPGLGWVANLLMAALGPLTLGYAAFLAVTDPDE